MEGLILKTESTTQTESHKITMKYLEFLFILFFNVLVAQAFKMSKSSFKDVLSDGTMMQQLAHDHPSFFKRHETSNISKILKSQMQKILQIHDKHLNQGILNRSHRAEFQKELKIKFKKIGNYTKQRLRKSHNEKTRRRQIRNRR